MESFAVRKARSQMMPPRQDASAPAPAQDAAQTASGDGSPALMMNGDKVIVIVDPYSTGCVVAQEALKRGYKLVVVWTKGVGENKTHVPTSCADSLTYYAEVNEHNNLTETAIAVTEAATPFEVKACICGGESGVAFCDALSEKLGLLTNGTDIPKRRDKKLQQELIKAAGLRSVRQAGSGNFADVEEFLRTEQYPVVVKPVESAGSDGVKLCHNFEEAKEHFHLLMNSQQRVGGSGAHAAVLCQEFLRGKEYVVDHVSLNGIHKTTMCWVYDKRQANGSAFVYFGLQPIDSESEEAKIVIPYIRGVLDAMEIKHGPTHGEVMMTSDGPCLVEMNCRAHGGDGNWVPMVRGLNGGYSQVSATIDAYMDPTRFHALPDKMPSPFKAAGQECCLVSYSKGTVKSTPGYEVIRRLPSFVYLETRTGPGSEVDYTVDLFTDIGSVILLHEDPEVVKKDIAFIRYMEEINGFFTYETKQEILKRPRGDSIALSPALVPRPSSPSKSPVVGKKLIPMHRRVFSSDGPMLFRHQSLDRPEMRPLVKKMTTVDASKEVVIIVNPHSTGCCIAKEVMARTYRVIAVWSKGSNPEMRHQAPLGCSDLKYFAEVEEKDNVLETAAAIQKSANLFRVVACICGGESGSELTDAISEKLGLRTNGTNLKRLNKKRQQDLVAAKGLRAARQAGGKKFSDVETFLQTEVYPIVVKPTGYSGYDGAKLCHNFEEAKAHFEFLMSVQQNEEDDEVVCQEFLRGREYLVDNVSRDGEHKTTMVWVHDKRPANGSSFVYFGLLPVESGSIEGSLVISYARAVLDTLGVRNGPSHTSIMMTDTGPCLVEMACNAHGGDGTWQPLVRALNGGYSQINATVDAYLDRQAFSLIPEKMPSPFKAAGQEVILVSYSRGQVKSTPGFDIIKSLRSFVYFETGVQFGSEVDYTVDPFTSIGSVILMHEDKSQLQEDLVRIRQMEKDNAIFVYEKGVDMMRSPSTGNLSSLSGFAIGDRPKTVFTSSRASVYW